MIEAALGRAGAGFRVGREWPGSSECPELHLSRNSGACESASAGLPCAQSLDEAENQVTPKRLVHC